MRLYKLADIGKIVSGSTPKTGIDSYWNGNIPWVTPKEISALDGPYLNDTERKITEEGYKSCSTSLLPKGSILFSSRAPIGLVAIANVEVCTNQGFKSIILNKGFYPLYIYYALKYNSDRLQNLGVGTTFLELSKSRFEEFQILIPDYLSQIKIATVLSKAEILIKQRKESIDLLNEYLKSTFLKMFGDLSRNEKNWEKKKIGDVCKVTKLAGFEYTKYINYKESGEIIVVRGLNVKDGKIKLDNVKYIDKNTSDFLVRSKLFKGDLVITYIGINIGDIAIVEEDDKFHLAPNVAKISVGIPEKLNPNYLLYFLMYNRKLFAKYTTNTAKQALNMGNIREIEFLLPGIKFQNQFCVIAEKTENIKTQFQNSLSDLKNLYASLSQRAFKGELDLSVIEIDKTLLLENKKEEPIISISPSIQKAIELSDKINKQFESLGKITTIPSGLTRQMEQWNKLQEQFKNITKLPNALLQAQKSVERIREAVGKVGTTKMPIDEETGFNWAALANRIKERYKNRHFNFEMLHGFIKKEKLAETAPYYSSEELKANPRLNDAEDLKSFIQTAVQNIEMDEKQQRQINPFLRLIQSFYNAEEENFTLSLHKEDFKLIKDKSARQRSGIYFSLVTEE